MDATPLSFENPIRDAISRVRFAPHSNNLLFSSWDNSLRLYDVESSKLMLEFPGEAALLDCCLENEFVAFSAASDGSIHRYDMHSGHKSAIGNHDDMATFVEYSPETWFVVGSVDGRVALEYICESNLDKGLQNSSSRFIYLCFSDMLSDAIQREKTEDIVWSQ